MTRALRIVVPHSPYHLASRGSNRQAIYTSDDERRLFLRLVGIAAGKHAWKVLAYCLMTNHYHLVVEIAEGGISAGMQWLNGGFSRTTNRARGREAHLFRNRFASRLVDSETHLLAACRYVVLDPVAAGLCRHPGEWRWSSYRATAGLEPSPSFLADAKLLAWFAGVAPGGSQAVSGVRRGRARGAPAGRRGRAVRWFGVRHRDAGANAVSRMPRRRATALRDEFLLDPDIVFLNHGSFGACPRDVFERYRLWQRELERNPVEFLARRLPALLDGVRERLAAYVGARPDDLVLVPNATSAVNVVARSLELGPGDDIVATDHEYGACDLLWQHVCARAGARYVRAELPLPLADPAAVADAVLARVTERTRAVYLSHVTSATALVLPVAEIARRSREAGALTIVDGAHGPGHVPVDMAALGVDAYAGVCHKWLCAPKGAGFLWLRSELQDTVEALVIGWGYGDDTTFVSRHTAAGTRDPAAHLSIPDAIEWQASHDWDAVRARCHDLARAARSRLAELTGLEPLAADSPDRYGQMVAARLPDCDADALQRRLYEEHGIEVVASRRWNGTPLLRASFQGHNDDGDLDRLLDALGRAL